MDWLACVAGICGNSFDSPPAAARPEPWKREAPAQAGIPEYQAPNMPQTSAGEVQHNQTEGERHQVRLTGQRKSLLVGINYYGSSCELHGCINDVKRMLPVLEQLGFPSDHYSQMVMLDEPGAPAHTKPTLANMREALAWLVNGAQPGDALLFHYSGHGGRMPRTDGRGEFHETLCPVDMEEAGMLLDTELFETLVKPLPSGCRLTCILDSCHSGGVLDLPYIFVGTQESMAKALGGEAVEMTMSKAWLEDLHQFSEGGNPMALLQDTASLGLGLWDLWGRYEESKKAGESGFATDEQENVGLAVAEVVAITGCRADQTSADVGDVNAQFHLKPIGAHGGAVMQEGPSGAGGALTSSFIETVEDPSMAGTSYLELLEQVRKRLSSGGFSQVPQFCSSLLIDLRQPFSLDTVSLPGVGTGGRDVAAYGGGRPDPAVGFLSNLEASGPQGAQMLEGHTGWNNYNYNRDAGPGYQSYDAGKMNGSQTGQPQQQQSGYDSGGMDFGGMLDTVMALGAAEELEEAFFGGGEEGDADGGGDD